MPLSFFDKFVYWNPRIWPPIGFFLNFLAIWLIWHETPSEMFVHSRILFQTAILDIFFLIQELIGWPITLAVDDIFTVFVDGYFALQFKQIFGHFGLFIFYQIHLFFYGMDLYSLTIQFAYRYFLLNRNIQIRLFRYLSMLFACVLLCSTSIGFYIFINGSATIDGIRPKDEQILMSVIDLKNLEMASFSIKQMDSTANRIWLYQVLVNFIAGFLLIIFLGWRIVRFVRITMFSEETRRMQRQLTRTLIMLAAYPLCLIFLVFFTNVSTFALYGNSIRKNPNFMKVQLAMSFLVHYLPVLNPIATIFTNSPYRMAMIRLIWPSYSRQEQIPSTTQQH